MAFKRIRDEVGTITTIESFFMDLRGRKIDSPWAHQVDLWRSYEKEGVSHSDVAMQLPTGSGKTLVGVVLAEWRRRKFNERVVYLCPTRQLAHQVATHAKDRYGIDVALLVGAKDEFLPEIAGDYLGAQRIAITTYAALFNVNPFFNDPHILICDDAHAAEQYIAKFWSFEIDGDTQPSLFQALVNALSQCLEPHEVARMNSTTSSDQDMAWCDKIPSPLWFDISAECAAIIDAYVSDIPLRFSWSQVRNNLSACHIYIDSRRILIRPFIPPTNTHSAFANAKQRIYMSATLGEGGELERMTGRKIIKRLEIPKGWEKQGLGRRLYFFPERHLADNEILQLNEEMFRKAGRSVVLVPNEKSARNITEFVQKRLGFPVFQAKDLESSKQPFLDHDNAVVVAANRYEGIDFPGDESHMLFVVGLPRATHLQERFLMDKMGASALFNERVLTRIIQAFGRCTRSATDYAAVVVEGEDLFRLLMKQETRLPLDPEMQAELEFGIQQAQGLNVPDALENLGIFLDQKEQWNDIDLDILSLRKNMTKAAFPGFDELQSGVQHEIDYQYAMWNGNYQVAKDACDNVLALLKDPILRGYRAWWNYLAASACWAAYKKGTSQMEKVARKYYSQALLDAKFVSWLSDLSIAYGDQETAMNSPDPAIGKMIERMEEKFVELGTSNMRRYIVEEKMILDGILNGAAPQFEESQRRLGLLLGFEAFNSDEQGAPDPWWIIDSERCIIFEDHSDARATSNLDAKKARQVAMHPNWLRTKDIVSKSCHLVPILVTPVTSAEGAAKPHLGDFYLWPLSEFQAWASEALCVIRRLRGSFVDRGDLVWRAQAAAELDAAELLPSQIFSHATEKLGTSLLS